MVVLKQVPAGSKLGLLVTDGAPMITIGDGVNSSGLINVTDFKRGPTQNAHIAFLKAIDSLSLEYGGTIYVLPGRYVFNRPVVVDRPFVTIWCDPGAKLVPCVGHSVGLFKGSTDAERFTLRGGRIAIEQWDASQLLLRFTDTVRPTVEDTHTLMSTTQGVAGAYMTLLHTERCLSPSFQRNVVLPHRGLQVAHDANSMRGKWNSNEVSNGAVTDFALDSQPGNVQPTMVRRECRGVFNFIGSAHSECNDNVMWGLGTTSETLDRVVWLEGDETVPKAEAGHWHYKRNRIEAVSATNALEIRRGQWVHVSENIFGDMLAKVAVAGDAVINVTSIDGTPTAELSDWSKGVQITNNMLHNAPLSGSDGVFVAATHCQDLKVNDNEVTLHQSKYAFSLVSNKLVGVQVIGNNFQGHLTEADGPIVLSPFAQTVVGFVLANNQGRKYPAAAVCVEHGQSFAVPCVGVNFYPLGLARHHAAVSNPGEAWDDATGPDTNIMHP